MRASGLARLILVALLLSTSASLVMEGRMGSSVSALTPGGESISVPPAEHVSPLSGVQNQAGVTNVSSSNWGGYAITGPTDSVQDVQGSWFVPSVDCSQTPNAVSASWIGMDGFSSSTVEQLGTDSSCSGSSASYGAWYEFYPQASVDISYSIKPGDVIHAQVSASGGASGGTYTLSMCDSTRNWCFQTSGTVSGADDDSAEWITEAYSICSPSCQEQPLADFGRAYYGEAFTGFASTNYAQISGVSGSTGSFGSVGGDTVYNIEMSGCPSGCPALTSGLSAGGTSFYTSWESEPTPRSTTTAVSPNPASAEPGASVTLTATVTDTGAGTASSPAGTVSWSASEAGGSFSSPTCSLTALSSAASSCAVSFTAPTTKETLTITAGYPGDSSHSASPGTSSLTVTPVTTITLLPAGQSTPLSASNEFALAYTMNGTQQTAYNSGGTVTLHADSGTSVVISASSTGSASAQEWVFDSQASAVTVGSGSTVTLYYYDLLPESVSYSIIGGGSPSQPSLTYSSAPTAPSSQPTAKSYALVLSQSSQSVWVLRGSTASVSSVLPGSAVERWATRTYAWVISQSNQTPSPIAYYHQYYMSFAYSVQGGGSGYSPPTVSYVSLGGNSSAPVGTSLWADANSTYSYTDPLPGSTAGERWDAGYTDSGYVASAGTVTVPYFHQFPASLSYRVMGGGDSGPPDITYTGLGQTETGFPAAFPPGEVVDTWLDAGSSYQFSSLLENSTSTERWYGSGASGTVSGYTSVSPTYYHQFEVPAGYSVVGGGSPSPPSLASTQLGQPLQRLLAVTPSTYWLDAGSSWSLTATLGGSTSTERWQTSSATTGGVSASLSLAPAYYHQFSATVSYSLVGGGSPTPPVLSGAQFGQAYDVALTGSPTAYWLDSGGQWEVPNPLGGSTTQERWLTSQPTNGTILQSTTVQLSYDHQYYLTVGLAPAAGGSVNVQSGWNGAGSTLQAVASANPGWKFEGWTGTGTGSSSAIGNSTSIIFSDPITESAVFYPSLTITAGKDGSVSYAAGTSATTGVVQGGRASTVYAPPGTKATLTENPSSFLYEFTGWTEEHSGTNGTISITLNAPTMIEASFAPNYPVIGGLVVMAVLAALGSVLLIRRRRYKRSSSPP